MGYLDGLSIAVTGAGRGIGRAVAMAAAEAGANVVVADFGVAMDGKDPDSEVANAVVEEIKAAGGNAVAVADTVTTMEGGARIVQTAVDSFGKIDGVVCVAGILRERMNLNDGTVEGLRVRGIPAFSVQHHPEAGPGPHDAAYLFAEFTDLMDQTR